VTGASKDNQKDENEAEDHVEDLKDKLYSNSTDVSGHPSAELPHEDQPDAPDEWRGPESKNLDMVTDEHEKPDQRSWLNVFLIFSVVFFVAAVGYAYFTLFSGGGVSPEKIEISVSGPISVTAGDPADFTIRVRNGNEVPLENVSLVASYPENTRSAKDMREVIQRERISLGTIGRGQQTEREISARLLSEGGDAKEINLQLEYRVPNSNAVYKKQRNYSVEIASSPVSMSVDGPNSINSGNEATFVVQIESNADTSLRNLVLSLNYPFGFSFDNADPSPDFANNVWRIEKLDAGEKRTIQLHGELTGQKNEERALKFRLGAASPNDQNAIQGTFVSNTQSVTIGSPYLGLSVNTNGQTAGEIVAEGGDQINVNVRATNNISVQISNLQLQAEFAEGPISAGSISSSKGLYRAGEGIAWNQRDVNALAALDAGESVSTSFRFGLQETSNIVDQLRNPTVGFTVNAQAQRVGQVSEPVPQNVTNTISRSIKVTTDAGIASNVFYNEGPFENTGPTPPEVSKETTYTIMLSVSNTVNHVTDAVVTAQLPGYVEWKGVTEPSSAAVEFNPVNGELQWNPADVPAGAGYTSSAETLAFKVGITPASSQSGSSLALIENIAFAGTDEFTGRDIKLTIKEDDTEIDDASADNSRGRVQ